MLLLSATTTAWADVRYNYTGQPVGSNALSIFSPTDKVTGYFVLPGSPASGSFSTPDFSNFAFQIGSLGLSKQQGASVGATLAFDANGNLTQWSFVIGQYTTPNTDPALVEVWANSANFQPAGDRITVYYQGTDSLGAVTAPGTWQIQASAVPEPAISSSLLVGLLVAFTAARRRRILQRHRQ